MEFAKDNESLDDFAERLVDQANAVNEPVYGSLNDTMFLVTPGMSIEHARAAWHLTRDSNHAFAKAARSRDAPRTTLQVTAAFTDEQKNALRDLHRSLGYSLKDNTPGSGGPSASEVGGIVSKALAVLGDFCDACSGSGETWRGECPSCAQGRKAEWDRANGGGVNT